DAVASAYQTLSFNQHPVGTGPWRFVRIEAGERAVFRAFDHYRWGPPATKAFEFLITRQPSVVMNGLRNGTIDWSTLPPDLYTQVRDAPGFQFASYADAVYYLLAYNLRPGMPFADHAVRTAVEQCIDKPATVDAA